MHYSGEFNAKNSVKQGGAVADPGGGGGSGGPDPPFGPRCKLFNIGPKVGPPLGPPPLSLLVGIDLR